MDNAVHVLVAATQRLKEESLRGQRALADLLTSRPAAAWIVQ
jgi:hypothetical protein